MPPSPPYFEGRFSNGPVWVEYLDNMLPRATLTDFAYGGAFSDFRNANGPFPGVSAQVAGFVDGGPQIKPRDLCIVWAGANNYIFDPLGADSSIVVDDVLDAIGQLAWAGCQNFLVPNLPDIGQSPFGIESGLQALLTPKIEAHNALLAEEVDWLRGDLGVQIILLDVSMLFDRTLAGQLGFQNTTLPCLKPPDPPDPLDPNDPVPVPVPTGACPVDDTDYIEAVAPGTLFMDGVHPTTAAHRMIATFAFGALAAAQGNKIAAAD